MRADSEAHGDMRVDGRRSRASSKAGTEGRQHGVRRD
jgi:hypothetical protein